MAHFRNTVQGNRGEASRLGTKDSGMKASIDGWDVGVDVTIRYNGKTGLDEIHVYKTNGSNGYKRELVLSINTPEARLNNIVHDVYEY